MAKKTKPALKTRAAAKGTKPSGPNGRDTLRDVEQLLYRQAECLDGKRRTGAGNDGHARGLEYQLPQRLSETGHAGIELILRDEGGHWQCRGC